MQQPSELWERRSASLLNGIVERCAALVDHADSTEKIQRWIDNNDVSPDVMEAASLYEQHGLSPTAKRLRSISSRFSDYYVGLLFSTELRDEIGLIQVAKELYEVALSLLQTIYETAVKSGKEPTETDNGDEPKRNLRVKRITESGDTRTKIIAALISHHEYEAGGNGCCLNHNPIRLRELASLADVSTGSASSFFKTQFGSHAEYEVACNRGLVAQSLRMLNGDLTPSILYNAPAFDIAG